LKTYLFRIELEPDEEKWAAHCPALLEKGGATWGHTREEALNNIRDVIQMVVQSLVERGEPIPETPADQVQVIIEDKVAVTV